MRGLGLITPGRYWFTGRVCRSSRWQTTRMRPTRVTSRVRGLRSSITMRCNEFRYEVVVGSLAEIRARAATHAAKTPPSWRFHERPSGLAFTATPGNAGWPIEGMLEVLPDGAESAACQSDRAVGGGGGFGAGDRRRLCLGGIQGRRSTGGGLAKRDRDRRITSFSRCRMTANSMRFVVPLGDRPTYRGPIVQLRPRSGVEGKPGGEGADPFDRAAEGRPKAGFALTGALISGDDQRVRP
jgi:hypothetical protein